MAEFEPGNWQIQEFADLYEKGRIDLQPEYQRGRVWNDAHRYDLIDTIMREWPIGVILLREEQDYDVDGHPVKKWDVVDGQQRITTLIEFKKGQAIEPSDSKKFWTDVTESKIKGFRPYTKLSPAEQDRYNEYRVTIARLKEYDVDDIKDIYQRLQRGMPMKIGERVKALKTQAKEHLRGIAGHKLFDVSSKRHQVRDGHWNLAAQFFKSAYNKDPLDRVEFEYVDQFLQNALDGKRMQNAHDMVWKILNAELRVISHAIDSFPAFARTAASPRTLKWCFAVLFQWDGNYVSLVGREHLAAGAVIEYFKRKDIEDTPEFQAYVKTGRTGRMDTEAVKQCLDQLAAYIINATEAEPLDKQRLFTAEQRKAIWEKSDECCSECKIGLTPNNFHADHIKPHAQGGKTEISNGQVLCTRCNFSKGGLSLIFPQ